MQQQDRLDDEIETHICSPSLIHSLDSTNDDSLSGLARFDRVDLDAIKAPSLIDMLLVHLSLSLSLSINDLLLDQSTR